MQCRILLGVFCHVIDQISQYFEAPLLFNKHEDHYFCLNFTAKWCSFKATNRKNVYNTMPDPNMGITKPLHLFELQLELKIKNVFIPSFVCSCFLAVYKMSDFRFSKNPRCRNRQIWQELSAYSFSFVCDPSLYAAHSLSKYSQT